MKHHDVAEITAKVDVKHKPINQSIIKMKIFLSVKFFLSLSVIEI